MAEVARRPGVPLHFDRSVILNHSPKFMGVLARYSLTDGPSGAAFSVRVSLGHCLGSPYPLWVGTNLAQVKVEKQPFGMNETGPRDAAYSASDVRPAMTTSISRARVRRSAASLLKSSRFLPSAASLPINSQSSASESSFSSFALRSCISPDRPYIPRNDIRVVATKNTRPSNADERQAFLNVSMMRPVPVC